MDRPADNTTSAEGLRAFDDRVRERDLDHFLIEELQADPGLRALLLARVAHAFDPPDGADPEVRKWRRKDGRETDVRVAYPDGSGDPPSLLIENKITDGFQEGQPESYAAEVARIRYARGARAAAAVLVAPRANAAVHGSPHFDASVALEDIADHLRGRLDGAGVTGEMRVRLQVRLELIEALCGKRAGSRWAPSPVAEVVGFAAFYDRLAREELPRLRPRPTVGGANAKTRFFDGFPRQRGFFPVAVQLKHEFGDRGKDGGWKYANIEFDGMGHRLRAAQAARRLFPADGSIYPAAGGKSLMFRSRTPAVVRDPAWFAAHRDEVAQGLRAVARLAAWLDENADEVRSLLSG